MKKNMISMALLTALGVLGALQTGATAQGGILLPEPVVAPVPVTVPRPSPTVVEYNYKPATKVNKQIPMPIKQPIAATGRVTHYQSVSREASAMPATNIGVIGPQGVAPAVAPQQSFGMGVFNPQRASARMMPTASPSN